MTAAYAPPIGLPPSIELVPPARLRVDESYQRSIEVSSSRNLIGRIAESWDWRLCVPLLVSRRDDGLYVIDGQHRREAAMKRGDIPYLPCCVSEYGSPAEEAQIFVDANRKRRGVVRVDTFRAQLLAGEPSAREIAGLVDAVGLRLAKTSGANNLQPGELNCIAAIERARRQHGVDHLGATLDLVAGSFAGEILKHGSPLIHAIAQLLKLHKKTALAFVLKKLTLEKWMARALARPGATIGGQSVVIALKATIAAELDPATAVGPAPMPTPQPKAVPASALPSPTKPVTKKPMTFEEQMAAVAGGAKLVKVEKMPSRPGYAGTLGGVGSSML